MGAKATETLPSRGQALSAWACRAADRVDNKISALFVIWLCLALVGPHQELYKAFFHVVIAPVVLMTLLVGRLRYVFDDPLFRVAALFLFYAAFSTFLIGLGPTSGHLRALRWTVELSFFLLALWMWMPKVVEAPGWWGRFLLALTSAAGLLAIIKFLIFEQDQARLSGLGGLHNPIHTGSVLLTLLVLGSLLLKLDQAQRRRFFDRSLLILTVAVVACVIFLSKSRGPMLAMAVYGVYAFSFETRLRHYVVRAALLALVLVVAFAMVAGEWPLQRYIEGLISRGSSYRLDLWWGYLAYPPDSWLLGFGLGTEKWYVPAFEQYWVPNGIPAGHPHSMLIGTLVETGLVGLGFLCTLAGLVLFNIWRCPSSRNIKLSLLGVLILVFLLGLTSGQGVIYSVKTHWLTIWVPVLFVWFWLKKQALETPQTK